MKYLALSFFVLTQAAQASVLDCSISEYDYEGSIARGAYVEVRDTDSQPQVVDESELFRGIQFQIRACNSCATRDGQATSKIEATFTSDYVTSTSSTDNGHLVASMKNLRGTVELDCQLRK